MVIAQVLEAAMLICFGLSWPINAYKNFKAGTAAGTSWQFILLITVGYLAGIAAKFASGMINWVLAVYFINLVCLAVNWAVYFRNCRLDAARLANKQAARIIDSSCKHLAYCHGWIQSIPRGNNFCCTRNRFKEGKNH